MPGRRYSATDRLLGRVNQGLAAAGKRVPVPADRGPANPDDRESANLMRVNHAGEVAAQGLYHGQALTARNKHTREHLLAAAEEEQAHLEWCEARLQELGDRPSRLRPLWYGGSFVMGAIAGLFGDRWSLGFVAETERQVSEHLDEHIERLPKSDQSSRAVLKKMREDEARHGNDAELLGGVPLPEPVRNLMRNVAKVMKEGAYRW